MKTRSLFLAVVQLFAVALMLTERSEAAAEVTVYDGPSTSSPSLPDAMLDFGSLVIRKPITRTITLKNTGTVTINNLSAALEGTELSVFTFTQPKVKKLTVGGSTTLTVTVTPTFATSYTATLHITTPEVLSVLTDVNIQVVSTEAGEGPTGAAVATTGLPITMPLIYDLTQPESPTGLEIEATTMNSPSQPISYQWYKDGKAVSGGTKRTLALSLVATQAGRYTVVVKNPYGSNTSPPADIVIVSRQTTSSITANEGASTTFTVTAVSGPATYQWSFVDAATSKPGRGKTLTLEDISPSDAGVYAASVVAGEMVVPVGSFTLAVRAKPVIDPEGVFGSASFGINQSIRWLIPMTGEGITSVTATGLPAGLSVVKGSFSNADSALVTGWGLSGHPTTAGFSRAVFRATNAAGTSYPITREYTVYPLQRSAIGTFTGLLNRATNAANIGGKVTVVVAANGSFTVKVQDGSTIFSGKGIFDVFVDSSASNARQTSVVVGVYSDVGNVYLSLKLDPDLGSVKGTLSFERGITETADFSSYHSPWGADRPMPKSLQGRYNSALTLGANADPEGPPTGGHAAYTIAESGAATYAGKLADGTAFAASGPADYTTSLPLYLLPYGGKAGVVWGYVFCDYDSGTSSYTGTISGGFEWYRPSAPHALGSDKRIYPSGFYTDIAITGGRYKAPPKDTVMLGLPEVTNNAVIEFISPAMAENQATAGFTLTRANALVFGTGTANPSGVKLSINSSTGEFSGSFTLKDEDPNRPGTFLTRPVNFTGLLRTGTSDGIGYFTLPVLPDTATTPTATLGNTPIVSGLVSIRSGVAP